MIKVIKRTWLPVSLPQLSGWFANFSLKFAEFADDLGFTADDVRNVQQDSAVVQWLADADEVAKANLDGFRKFRDETLFAGKNSTSPQPPSTALPPAPPDPRFAIIQRLVNLVDRIELADNYTSDIGAQLGILVPTADRPAPDDWKTSLKVRDMPNYQLEIEFVKGGADGVLIQMQSGESDVWTNAGTFVKRPVVITVTPSAPNAPVTVKLRARLLKGNEPVGEYSDIVQTVARA